MPLCVIHGKLRQLHSRAIYVLRLSLVYLISLIISDSFVTQRAMSHFQVQEVCHRVATYLISFQSYRNPYHLRVHSSHGERLIFSDKGAHVIYPGFILSDFGRIRSAVAMEAHVQPDRKSGEIQKRGREQRHFMKLQRMYTANGGLLYYTNFLAFDDYSAILSECRSLYSKLSHEKNSIAILRRGLRLDSKSLTHSALLSEAMAARIAKLTGADRLTPVMFSAELRQYGKGSAMHWHRDDMLYDPPQIEAIFTLDNSADCFTEWSDKNGKRDLLWTEPNSLLLVRAGADGPEHRVTHVKHGKRTILKFMFREPTSVQTRSYACLSKELFPTQKRPKNAQQRKDVK